MVFPAYILSGGQSRRFGSDKARYETPAGVQLCLLVDRLRSAGHTVHVVADRADRYTDLGLTCLVDLQPDSGPLAGLATALAHQRAQLALASDVRAAGWLLLVNCDQRVWQADWYTELLAHTSPDVDASIYFDTMWQPLPGLYHVDLFPLVMDRLTHRRLSLHGLLDSLGDRIAQVPTQQPPSRWSFNTHADL